MATRLVSISQIAYHRPPSTSLAGPSSHLPPTTTTSSFTILFKPSQSRGSRKTSRRNAVDGSSSDSLRSTVYNGSYGPWRIEDSDVREVILYRSGLVTAASAFVIAASSAFLSGNASFRDIIEQNIDVIYGIGAGGLGLSLILIHIYVTEIKRTLQALWLLGIMGSIGTSFLLARPADLSLVEYVVQNPLSVWFVGPLFASLTGLVFKEGLCYGKLEAGILTFVIPSVLLGHLTGIMDDSVKLVLLGSWMALFVIFAGRKFTQPIKDDIGDKSVFMFNSLSENDKQVLLEKLEKQKFEG